MAGPTIKEPVIQGSLAELGRPAGSGRDVEDPAVDGVGVGSGDHAGALGPRCRPLAARQERRTDPGPGRSRGEHGGQTTCGSDPTGGEHRDRHALKDRLEQREGCHVVAAMAAALGAAGNNDVDTCSLGRQGLGQVADARRDRDPRTTDGGQMPAVGPVAHRDQGGSTG